MDPITLVIILSAVLLMGVGVVWFVRRDLRTHRENDSFRYLKQDIEAMRREVGEGIWKTVENNRDQSRESARLIREITEELVRVNEGQKQVLDITDQLKSFQDMLKNPQQRGVVGEFYLETLLRNVMPPGSYQMQYSFPNGTIVDAAIFIRDQIIPVDSKFSLENYNRIAETNDSTEKARLEKLFINDLKVRISETAKYIQPEEGTSDFAFMFIPHEAIYYDLLINKVGAITEETENLVQRAAGKQRVIIVSPTSFLAYLQTVLQGLKAMKIEESAKLIKKRVEDLQRHLSSYEGSMDALGKSMNTAVNHYNKATKEFRRVDKDMYRITGTAGNVKLEEIATSTLNKDEE